MTPEDRISFIVQDSNIHLVITENPVEVNCSTVIQVQEMLSLNMEGDIPEICEGDIEDICYIIYTSGSTGTPKGCIIQQKSVSNYINWAIKQYFPDGVHEGPIHFPMFTSPSVDLTVTSIFAPLLSGNTMDVYPNELQSLKAIFLESQASIVKLTPTHLKFVAAMAVQSTKVKSIIVGGEQLTKLVCDSIASSNIRIYNEYGPTESTVGCMIYEYAPNDPYPVVPIGKAIDNLGIYILNSQNQICLPGVEGEIYIAGVGLAAGYTDKHMTSQKFVDVSISGRKQRMYRTGDHGYYLNDGNIIYTGRKDTQKKVRGYRIELAEIEACLIEGLSLESVYSFIHNERIIAAVVPKGDDPNIVKFVVDYAKRKLPIYMVPDSVIPIKQLPMLTSGKMDEAAILSLLKQDSPAVHPGDAEIGEALKEIMANIRSIWVDILNRADFDDTDSFFDVGGNSILLLQLHNRIEAIYPGVQLMDYFKYTSIKLISEYLDTGLNQAVGRDINALPPHYLTGANKQPARINMGIFLSDKMTLSLEHSCRKYNISEVRFIGALLMAIMSSFVQSNYVSVAIAEEENVWKPIIPKMTDFDRIVQAMEENRERLGSQNLDISIAVSDKMIEQQLPGFDAVFIFERENRAINLSYDHVYLNGEQMERMLNLVKDILESIDD
ncbi:Tyrocidine synthase 3 [compost metagenome]